MKLAFIGKMRSGKDEAALHLLNYCRARLFKFADPLYAMEAAIFEIAGIDIPVDKTKRRLLLQFLGTQWGRETINPNIWVDVMDRTLTKYQYEDIFITDCRFPNEIELLRKHNFKIIKIDRPLEDRIKAGATNLDHISETVLDNYTDFDLGIHNDINDLKTYHSTVVDVYNALRTEKYEKGGWCFASLTNASRPN
jgi:hypothetical protein